MFAKSLPCRQSRPRPHLISWCFSVFLAVAPCFSAQEPFFDGLGSYTRKVTTSSSEAQKYFNQGLNFYYGFNHGAAIRAFTAAAALDPNCAMAHWGIATTFSRWAGPDEKQRKRGWDEIKIAKSLHAATARESDSRVIRVVRGIEHDRLVARPDDRLDGGINMRSKNGIK